MDANDKLDLIITNQETIIEKLQDLEEGQEELREGISNLGLPGRGYEIFTPEED